MQFDALAGPYPISGWGLHGLSPADCERIHTASLDILENVGIRVEGNPRALAYFDGGGARVERQGADGLVKIPAAVVEKCLQTAPKQVILCGRTPNYDHPLLPYQVTFTPFGEMIQAVDRRTREIRPTTQQDSADIARLCDASPEVGVMQRPVASLDKPLGTHPVFNAQALFRETAKHVLIGPIDAQKFRVIAAIAAAHAGGSENLAQRPLFTTLTCPTPPLRLEKNCADLIIESALLPGGGLVSSPVPLSGISTPVTLAGTLVSITAEALSGLILAQLVRPGTRVILSNSGTIMDLRFMAGAYGAPEMGMISAGMARMARYYGLPSHCTGIHSDSKVLDAQAGYESATGGLVTAMAGANIINGLGSLELGLTFDYAKFMLDLEAAANIRTVLGGMPTDDDQMAVTEIKTAGPGGDYLERDHTFAHMRDRSRSRLFDRRYREGWEKLEKPDLVERAYERVEKILSTHTPPPVAPEVEQEVAEIIAAYMAVADA